MRDMSSAPNLHTLLDEALTEVPVLSRLVLDKTQDELESKPQHYALLDAWRKLRGRFIAEFEGALLPLLQAARRGEDPLQRKVGSLDSLSLVDETQALQDVAVAHVIQVVEDQSKPELHQLGNFFAALRGTARARKNDNPLRPALFAQALHDALGTAGNSLDAQRRYELMRVAATPMAQGLHRIYTGLCGELRAAELSNMVQSHAAHAQDMDAHQRFAAARALAEPATFDSLARRVHEHNTRPQPLHTEPMPLSMRPGFGAPGASTTATEPAPLPAAPKVLPAPAFLTGTGPDMLSRLYDQILADPRLLPPLKALLARLQVAVVRLARTDATLLRRQDHPTWLLLNRVAAHGMAFERADDERLQSFLRFMEAELLLLVDTPAPSAALFQQVLDRVEQHLFAQAQQRSERSAVALAALEREQLRAQWQGLLREQIDAQIAEAPIGPRLHNFLRTTWVDVIVHAMVQHGRDAAQPLAHIDLVDELLASLEAPSSDAERQRLRNRLPGLIAGLRAGCDSIKLPEPKREPVLQELMHQHSRLLRGLPALPEPEAQAAAKGKKDLSPEELLQRLLNERESQIPDNWAHTEVNRGHLPTVPVQLYTEHDSPDALAAIQAWLDGIRIGEWFHLFIQSQWITAQVAWISESGQFFLFVGQDVDERHSLTRGALEKLLANGLITALEDHGVVQRAVEQLMAHLNTQHGA